MYWGRCKILETGVGDTGQPRQFPLEGVWEHNAPVYFKTEVLENGTPCILRPSRYVIISHMF